MKTSRRQFLRATLGASTLAAFHASSPALLSQAATAKASRDSSNANILVVLQLTGGNDGLNTVVPFADDAYHAHRPTLRLSPDRVHKINDQLGFHPEMEAFLRLHEQGLLAIVQGVGYPKNSRDHDQALWDWQTAQPGRICQTGWLGRAVDHVYAPGETDLPGLFFGHIPIPFALHTEAAVVPSIGSLAQWSLPSAQPGADLDSFWRREAMPLQDPRPAPANALLPFLRQTTVAAAAASKRIAAAAAEFSVGNQAKYPSFQLAQTLRAIAQLIRADVGIRIYVAELGGGDIGGFDTHANQAANHGALLRQLSQSVAAFLHDLRQDKLLGRVLLTTFSEFGRTLEENGRRGTDHGSAAPMFLAGGGIRPGVIGPNPDLTSLEGGEPKFHTDFRRVYATLLDRWLGFDSRAILGTKFEPLDLFS